MLMLIAHEADASSHALKELFYTDRCPDSRVYQLRRGGATIERLPVVGKSSEV